jgi:hypothetical protein
LLRGGRPFLAQSGHASPVAKLAGDHATRAAESGGGHKPKNNFANWRISQLFTPRAGVAVMDVASLREKAALCLRISRGLSWNNPARLQLLELAERLERQAEEIELQNHPAEKVA